MQTCTLKVASTVCMPSVSQLSLPVWALLELVTTTSCTGATDSNETELHHHGLHDHQAAPMGWLASQQHQTTGPQASHHMTVGLKSCWQG
jgi:hypothetical protein